MNYAKHYESLVNRAKSRKLTGYIEKHHIVPKCMGGIDSKENLVELTPEEHYVAHLLLVKMYPNNDSLVYAAMKMTVASKLTIRSNKAYGWVRKKFQKTCQKRIGDKNPSFGKPWFHNPSTLENKKFSINEVPIGWIKGRKSKTKTKPVCKNCGEQLCARKEVCKNGQRIKRLIDNFNFNCLYVGTNNFYEEYDRVVAKLKKEYLEEMLSIEDLKVKYNIKTNETMRCILKSLKIERRNLSQAVKNYCNKSG